MVDLTWCIVFLLPFPWHHLIEAERNAFAFALHDCNGRSFAWNRGWIDDTLVRQATQDGLGLFTVVDAWPSSMRAENCRRAVVAADIHAQVRVECLATIPPAASWWNHTCVADVVLAPSSSTSQMVSLSETILGVDAVQLERIWMIVCSAMVFVCGLTYLVFWMDPPRPVVYEPPSAFRISPKHADSAQMQPESSSSLASASSYLGDMDAEGEESVFSPYGTIRDAVGGGGDSVPSNSPRGDSAPFNSPGDYVHTSDDVHLRFTQYDMRENATDEKRLLIHGLPSLPEL